jgi:hypothetical protein
MCRLCGYHRLYARLFNESGVNGPRKSFLIGVFYCWVPLVVGLALTVSTEATWISTWHFELAVGIFLINTLYGFLCAVLCSKNYGDGGGKDE